MPRPRRFRRIGFEPGCIRFDPRRIIITLDDAISAEEPDIVTLTKDELETLRLHDLEDIEQIKAAKKMDISQPTFHRTLLAARKKVSDALVNGKAIKIEGGNIKMIQGPGRGQGPAMGRGLGRLGQVPVKCVCPSCNYEEPKIRGTPCRSKKCPKCGTIMLGE